MYVDAKQKGHAMRPPPAIVQWVWKPACGTAFAVWRIPSELFLVGDDELVALAVDVDDFHLVVLFEVLAQLGDVDVH